MQKLTPKAKTIRDLFNSIAYKYDSSNEWVSLKQHRRWRRKMANLLPEDTHRILDVATGSGEALMTFHESGRLSHGVGLDFAESMIRIAERKIAAKGLSHKVRFLHGDALALPFTDEKFDVVTMSFGMRNVTDAKKSLEEMYRVLKPGGIALILETSMPKNVILRLKYKLFLLIAPFVSRLFTKKWKAYKYLARSIKKFPPPEKFARKMKRAGFTEIELHPVTFGVATIFKAKK